jgi:hypothetical protein
MSRVGSLEVKLGLDQRNFANGIRQSAQRLNTLEGAAGRASRGMDRMARQIGASARRSALALGALGAAGAAALTLLVRSSLKAIDEQAKLARSLDGTIDGLRGLQIAAGDAGVSSSALTSSIQMLNRRLGEAERAGTPAFKALERLGLTAAELGAMDVDERIAVLADRVKGLGLSAAQTGDLLRQFGIRNADMINLMREGGDAIRAARQEVDDYGLSISEVDAAAIEAANDAMSRIGRSTEAAGNAITIALAPALKVAADRINEMTRESERFRDMTQRATDSAIDGFARVGLAGSAIVDWVSANPWIAPLGIVGYMAFGKAGLAGVGVIAALHRDLMDGMADDTTAAQARMNAANRQVEAAERSLQIARNQGHAEYIASAEERLRKSQEFRDSLAEEASAQGLITDSVAKSVREINREIAAATGPTSEFRDILNDILNRPRGEQFGPPPPPGRTGGVSVEDLVEPHAAAAVKIAEIEDRAAERHREMMAGRVERIRESLLSEEEARGEKLARDLETLAEGFELQLLSEEDYLAQREELRQRYEEAQAERRFRELDAEHRLQQERERLIAQTEATIQRMQMQTASMALGLMDTLAGESKAWAVASIALHKSLSIAEAVMNTANAVTRALAVDPTGSLAARVAALGKVQIGIIAATGLAQAARGGGSSGGGGGGGGRSGSAAVAAGPAQAMQPRQTITVEGMNPGDLFSGEMVMRMIDEAQERGATLQFAR